MDKPTTAGTKAVGQFEGYVDGEPLVTWLDRANMPEPGAKLYLAPASADNPSTAGATPADWLFRSRVADLIHLLPVTFEFQDGDRAAGESALADVRKMLAAPVAQSTAGAAQQPPAVAEPVELMGVREEIAEGSGFWRECSGCYDTEDGHPTQNYAYSKVFGCSLGNGCSECGGIGAVWDNTDYQAMARDWDKDDGAAPALNPSKVRDTADSEDLETALRLLSNLKRDLEHARRFSPDTLATYRRACCSAEGDIEEFLLERRERIRALRTASKEGDQAATDAELRVGAVKPPLFDKDPTNVQF